MTQSILALAFLGALTVAWYMHARFIIADNRAQNLLHSASVAWADNEALHRKYAHLGVRMWRRRHGSRYAKRCVWHVRESKAA